MKIVGGKRVRTMRVTEKRRLFDLDSRTPLDVILLSLSLLEGSKWGPVTIIAPGVDLAILNLSPVRYAINSSF